MRRFNPDMLAIARDATGSTQADIVSTLCGAMSQGKLSKIENGLIEPSIDDVKTIAGALGFKTEFFFHPHVRLSAPATYNRKRKKLSGGDWSRIFATSEIYRITASLLLRSVELAPKRPPAPLVDVEKYNGNIEQIATAMRQHWRIPRGPLEDVTSIVESAGIIVVSYDFGTDLCDGFGQLASEDMPAMIFINSRQPKDRFRFTLCHELGHIIMHSIPSPEMENEANRFAAEFLMPTLDIAKDFYNLSMEKLMSLKMHWRTSMHSLVYKARSCGRITDSTYNYYMVSMSKKGWKTKEPLELNNVKESPKLFSQLIKTHLGPLQYSLDDLASLTGLGPAKFEEMHSLESKPRLRLVVG